MKKALLITYFFPPAQTVAGARTYSWAKYFHESGIEPTVVTRHWKGNETTWDDLTKHHQEELAYEKCNGYEIYKLPSRKIKVLELVDSYFSNSGLVSKFIYMLINALGYFNSEADARASFKKFLFGHLKKHNYDLIIVSSPPLNLIRLTTELKREFNIPVHVDFRDLWNNGYLKEDYVPPFNIKWIDRFKKYHLSRWMKEVDSCSAVSGPIANYLEGIFKKNCWVLTNGFDQDLYNPNNRKANTKFTIALMGTYYAAQQMELISKGLSQFLADKKSGEVTVLLVGVNVNSGILNSVQQNLPSTFIENIDRVNPAEAAALTINSDVILHAAWKGYRGIYTTKLFDFIASGNNILLAPGDNDVADALLKETGTGRIADDSNAVADNLEGWYLEWKNNGALKYFGKLDAIGKYGRRNITKQFAELLKQKHLS